MDSSLSRKIKSRDEADPLGDGGLRNDYPSHTAQVTWYVRLSKDVSSLWLETPVY